MGHGMEDHPLHLPQSEAAAPACFVEPESHLAQVESSCDIDPRLGLLTSEGFSRVHSVRPGWFVHCSGMAFCLAGGL